MPNNLKAPEFYDELSAALHDLVKFAPNGHTARRIAALTNMPYSTLMNGLSQVESNSGCRLALDSLEAIVGAAGGERFMAHYFATKAGGVFVQLPRLSGSAEEARRVVLRTMDELGALCRNFEAALSESGPGGSDVTDEELREFRARANRLLSTAQSMVSACDDVLKAHTI